MYYLFAARFNIGLEESWVAYSDSAPEEFGSWTQISWGRVRGNFLGGNVVLNVIGLTTFRGWSIPCRDT